MDGAALRIHRPFEVLVTAPANGAGFDLQAVIYQRDGRVWRTPPQAPRGDCRYRPDGGGRAVRGDRSMAAGAIGVRTNGLAAEYFHAERGIASWADLNRPADKRGYVTAVNQPDSTALGSDPFGTSFTEQLCHAIPRRNVRESRRLASVLCRLAAGCAVDGRRQGSHRHSAGGVRAGGTGGNRINGWLAHLEVDSYQTSRTWDCSFRGASRTPGARW